MINGSNIRLPNGQFSTLVTPVNKDGVTQLITPVDANGNVITGGADPSQITSETAPTTRADGSLLQDHDRWQNTVTNEQFFWDTTLGWVSEWLYLQAFSSFSSATSFFYRTDLPTTYDIYFKECSSQMQVTANNDANNYWIAECKYDSTGTSMGLTTAMSGTPTNTQSLAIATVREQIRAIDQLILRANMRTLALTFERVGNPAGSLVGASQLMYKFVYNGA